jgi:hypothetical protein
MLKIRCDFIQELLLSLQLFSSFERISDLVGVALMHEYLIHLLIGAVASEVSKLR